MRLTSFISAMAALTLSGICSAQTFTEFASCEFRVGANFPGEPMARDISYISVNGVSVPAGEFSVESDAGRFVLTAVDFSGNEIDMQQAMDHAAESLRQKGEVLFEADEELEENIPARQFSLAEENGNRVLATAYMYDRRLYILEAAAPPGVPPTAHAVHFVQSIMVLDASGREVDPYPDANTYQAANC
jgi:hypothetical protein